MRDEPPIPAGMVRFLVLSAGFLLCACQDGANDSDASRHAGENGFAEIEALANLSDRGEQGASSSPALDAFLFESLAADSTGIDHIYRLDLEHPLKRLYNSVWACAGVMAGDFNGDGEPDLFFTASAGENLLYLNRGDWRFEEVATIAGVTGDDGFAAGGSVADVDGDDDLDIYVCNYDSPNQLFLNTGNDRDGIPQFREAAGAAGLDISDACATSTFCDYDRDGDLDLFVLTNRMYREGGLPEGGTAEVADGELRIKPGLEDYYGIETIEGERVPITIGRKDYLFRNDSAPDGQLVFADVSDEAGFGAEGYGLSATWWDHNSDGYPDLYIANDFRYADRLMHNNGDGTFTDVAPALLPRTPFFSMGSAAGDLNNDGWTDLLGLDMAATTHYKAKVAMGALTSVNRHVLDHSVPPQDMRNAVFINSGAGPMLETAFQSGVAASDWSWTPLLGDFDCDGHLDIFITNGMVRDFTNADFTGPDGYDSNASSLTGRTEWDLYEKGDPNPEQNRVYRNKGNGEFEDVSRSWGLGRMSVSFGACWADFDRDGDLDIIVTNLDEPPSVYRNRVRGNRIIVVLRDEGSRNRHGLGARIKVETDHGAQIRSIHPANGFLNSNEPAAHFGLADSESVRTLTVEWADGATARHQAVRDLPANCRIVIDRDPDAPVSPAPPATPPMFTEAPSPLGNFSHREAFFDDFLLQNLLPEKQSVCGPGMAWGDADGDGRNDLIVSCGAGQRDYLFFNNQGRGDPLLELRDSIAGETNAPLFFDADGDGDLDLYLARGSYEFPENSPLNQDRLYFNLGNAAFEPAPPGVLPESFTVSGQVAAADFDRDGDLDLVVAGRVIAGRFPLAPPTSVLRNDRERDGGSLAFVDVTAELAPSLLKAPTAVKSAIWSDADGDGWIDLFMAMDRGPVRLLMNREGTFAEETEERGLKGVAGRWNSLTPGDFDGDGDMDYLAGNLGLNTKYHPSPGKPDLLLYGDMDGSGNSVIVEAKHGKDGDPPLPVRGRA